MDFINDLHEPNPVAWGCAHLIARCDQQGCIFLTPLELWVYHDVIFVRCTLEAQLILTVTTCLYSSGGKSGLLLCCFASLHLRRSCSVTLCVTPHSTSSSMLFACRTTFSPKGHAPVDSAWRSWRTTPGSRSTSISPSTLWWPGRTAPSLMKLLNGGR